MNKEKWSDDRKQSFIKNYINHPALWNVKDPNYAIKSKVSKQNIIWRAKQNICDVVERGELQSTHEGIRPVDD